MQHTTRGIRVIKEGNTVWVKGVRCETVREWVDQFRIHGLNAVEAHRVIRKIDQRIARGWPKRARVIDR